MVSMLAGVVELVSDFLVCDEGKSLSPESARILVCFMLKLLSRKLLCCSYRNGITFFLYGYRCSKQS